MAVPYTVQLPGGGSMTVNANSPEAARQNAGVGDNAQVYVGGHQTIQTSGGQTVQNQNAAPPTTVGPSTNPGNPGTGLTNPRTGAPWSFADLEAYFAQTSGMSQKQLDENKRQFDATLAQQIAQMQAIGIPQIEIQRRAQELQDQQFQKQLALATQAQQAQLSGQQANGQPTETAREFNQQNSLAQGQLGLSYATQAANFAASNPFQLSDFMRGTAQNNNVPTYLRNLQNNVVQGSGATVGPNPAPAIRFGDVAGNLAGGGAGYSQTNPAQQAIGGIYQRGANALAPGTLESLAPNELENLTQGINQGYGSAAGPAFLQAYKSNPVRQQTAQQTGYMAA